MVRDKTQKNNNYNLKEQKTKTNLVKLISFNIYYYYKTERFKSIIQNKNVEILTFVYMYLPMYVNNSIYVTGN